MKILKPGKVEQRKFVCEKCGCVFTAHENDIIWLTDADFVCCPTCEIPQRWDNGEPYKEPVEDKLIITDQFIDLVRAAYHPDREKADEILCRLLDYEYEQIKNGVTFREG